MIEGFEELIKTRYSSFEVYPDSFYELHGSEILMIKTPEDKRLIVAGDDSSIFQELYGAIWNANGVALKDCELTVENSKVIRRYFSFTNPVSLKLYDRTIGLGDRLGLASPGHIRTIKGFDVKPVLAQQSMRELNLTGRNFDSVLSDAVWAVFRENYRGGFGADADHLKTKDEVKQAIEAGYTMITLDCSNYITDISEKSEEELKDLYLEIHKDTRERLEEHFLDRTFTIGGLPISFTRQVLQRDAIIYQRAIDFATEIYHELIKVMDDKIDFEISIDETSTPTKPSSHFFVAYQLNEAGVRVSSLAPRFCGEFQKGIDYIGDVKEFDEEFKSHVKIAEDFGYKISVHSGSDKFSIFPTVGRETRGRFHVKTAGTNWLEAIKVIIKADPCLYREIHSFGLEHLNEARAYYHITANPDNIPDVYSMSDEKLLSLMYQDDARQVIHITYGLILQARKEDGAFLFRDRIYNCLHKNEQLYYDFLKEHIGKHLKALLG